MRPEFGFWMEQLKENPRFHNKQWQYFWALNSAASANAREGRRAIGFGVGREPIPALLARLGWHVLASDFPQGENAQAWTETNQLATMLADLNDRGICDSQLFEERVQLASLDMNRIPHDLQGQFDFVWSLCALGHIGGYEQGLAFIESSYSLLRPGGIAVHTTEMDLEGRTRFDTPGLSLYQRRDLERVIDRLTSLGALCPRHDFFPGSGYLERYVDHPPYGEPHLRLSVADRTVVPVVLFFRKPATEGSDF